MFEPIIRISHFSAFWTL